MNVDIEMATVLRTAESAGVALAGLFEIAKARRKSLTHALLATRADISKSYLSEVMSGKKRLNPRYTLALASALKLGLLETACLEALAKRDALAGTSASADDADVKMRAETEENVRKARRVLALLALSETPPNEDALLSFDIYAALSLFREPPYYTTIAALFADRERTRVYNALDDLVRSGSLVKSADGQLRYSEKGMVHNVMRNTTDFVAYWQASLDDARERVATQAERKDVTCFLSYAVSVKKEAYAPALESLKKSIFEFATGVEAQEADMLVRLNLQVYPTREA